MIKFFNYFFSILLISCFLLICFEISQADVQSEAKLKVEIISLVKDNNVLTEKVKEVEKQRNSEGTQKNIFMIVSSILGTLYLLK